MVHPSGSETERGYSGRARIPRLRIEPNGLIQPASGFSDSRPQRSGTRSLLAAMYELAIICFLKVWRLRTFGLDMRG
jgi:hypothetical protein